MTISSKLLDVCEREPERAPALVEGADASESPWAGVLARATGMAAVPIIVIGSRSSTIAALLDVMVNLPPMRNSEIKEAANVVHFLRKWARVMAQCLTGKDAVAVPTYAGC